MARPAPATGSRGPTPVTEQWGARGAAWPAGLAGGEAWAAGQGQQRLAVPPAGHPLPFLPHPAPALERHGPLGEALRYAPGPKGWGADFRDI